MRRDQGSVRSSSLSASVVICAYTEERWDDVLAAVGSVRAQQLPPHEIIVVVDHNPALYSRLRTALADALVVENRFQRGLSGGKNTGVEVATGDVVAFLDDDAVAEHAWLPHLVAGYAQAGRDRGRRADPSAGGDPPTRLVPRGVRLDGGLHVRRTRARPGSQPPRRQRVIPARGVRRGRRFPRGHRPVRRIRQAVGLRGDGVLHPACPTLSRGSPSCLRGGR